MRVNLRNLDIVPLVLDLTGEPVEPQLIAIGVGQSETAMTSLSILDFRNLTEVDIAITAAKLSMVAAGGTKALG